MTKNWNQIAADLLVGRKIVSARYMTDAEANEWMLESRPVVVTLDNGISLIPMSDDEGNDGGALFTTDEQTDCLPTIAGGRHGSL